MSRKRWTVEEDEFLRSKLNVLDWTECANHLNRPVSSVYGRVNKLGLKQSKKFRASLSSKYYSEANAKTQFKAGDIPWNKGKKGVIKSTPGMQKTQFKKGNLPMNTLSDGVITIRKERQRSGKVTLYKWIRLSKANWIPYHKYLWEKAHGPIPKGYVLSFKDGDTMNCVLENIELITYQENMNRNTIHRYPDDVKALIRTQSKLDKTLKNYAEK